MEYGEKFLTLLGGVAGLATLIIAAAQFMGKRWIEGWFERKNGDYQHQLDAKLRKYESDLDVKNREIQNVFDTRLEQMRIEYGNMYPKRLEVIENIHNGMIDLHYKYLLLAKINQNIEQGHPEKNPIIEEQLGGFSETFEKAQLSIEYYSKNKIYLSKTLARKIDVFFDYYHSLISSNIGYEKDDGLILNGIRYKKGAEKNVKLLTDFYKLISGNTSLSIESVIGDIQNEFRRLIGDVEK